MKTLRRLNYRDCIYFITCNTYERQRVLLKEPSLFCDCWRLPAPLAWVILPEHFHLLVECGRMSISDIMHSFKITYSRYYRDRYGPGRIWQNRFWDHLIRDAKDYDNHLCYIHYNPVKHGYVKDPFLHEHSSLHSYYEKGYYDRNWGVGEEIKIEGDFGE